MVVCTSHLLDQPSISICLLGVSKISGPDPPDLGLFSRSEGSLSSIVLWDQRPCHSWCLFSLSSSLLLRVWIFFFLISKLSGSIKLSTSLWPLSLSSFAWTTSVTSQLVFLKLLQPFLAHQLVWSTRIPNLIQIWSWHPPSKALAFKPFVRINLHFTHLNRSAFSCAFKALEVWFLSASPSRTQSPLLQPHQPSSHFTLPSSPTSSVPKCKEH